MGVEEVEEEGRLEDSPRNRTPEFLEEATQGICPFVLLPCPVSKSHLETSESQENNFLGLVSSESWKHCLPYRPSLRKWLYNPTLMPQIP